MYKKLCLQIKNMWDGELHNIVQMSFGMSTAPNGLAAEGTINATPYDIDIENAIIKSLN